MKIGICFVGVASHFLLILALVTTQRIGQSDAFAPPQSAVPLSRQQSLHWQTTHSRRQYQKHQSSPYQQKQPTPLVLHGVAPGILTSTFETISAFSKSSLSSAASGGGSSIVAGAVGSQAQLLQGMTQFSTSKRVFGLRQALILLLHIQNKTNPKNIFNTDSGVRLKHFPQFRNKNVKAAT